MSSDADADANTNTSDSERQSVRRQASASQSVSDSDATNVDNVDSDLAAERRNSDKVVTCTERRMGEGGCCPAVGTVTNVNSYTKPRRLEREQREREHGWHSGTNSSHTRTSSNINY